MPGVVPACPSKHPRHTAVVSAAKHRRAAFFSASCCICCASSRIRCPDTAAFRFSPPLVARPLTRLAIRSGKSHPGLQTQPQPVRHRFESHRSRAIRPPDRYGRVRAVRDSPSNAATCHRAVPTGTHSTELPGDRRDRHKREPRLGPRRPASPKDSTKSEPQGPLQARGVPGVARCQTAIARFGHESPRFVVPCHDFAVLASHFRDGVGTPEKKCHLRSCSDRRDRAMSGFGRGRSHRRPGNKTKNYCRRFVFGGGPTPFFFALTVRKASVVKRFYSTQPAPRALRTHLRRRPWPYRKLSGCLLWP